MHGKPRLTGPQGSKNRPPLPGGPIEEETEKSVPALQAAASRAGRMHSKPGGPIRRNDDEEEYVSVTRPSSASKKRPVSYTPPVGSSSSGASSGSQSSKRMLASAGDFAGITDSDSEDEDAGSPPDGNEGTAAVGSGAFPRRGNNDDNNNNIQEIPPYRNPNRNRALRFLQELASYLDVDEAELYRTDVDPDEFEKTDVANKLLTVDVFEFLAANCTASVVGSIRRAWRLIGEWIEAHIVDNPKYSKEPNALSQAIAADDLFEILAEVTAWIMRNTKLQTLQRSGTEAVMDKHKWDTLFLAGSVRRKFGYVKAIDY